VEQWLPYNFLRPEGYFVILDGGRRRVAATTGDIEGQVVHFKSDLLYLSL